MKKVFSLLFALNLGAASISWASDPNIPEDFDERQGPALNAMGTQVEKDLEKFIIERIIQRPDLLRELLTPDIF